MSAAGALVDLVESNLPQRFYSKDEQWRMLGAAMVVRMSDTVRSILALTRSGFGGDAMILLRTLYEQIVIYCWFAINPEAHLGRWREDAEFQQLKLHNDALPFDGQVLTASQVEHAAKARKLPNIANLAGDIDNYWPSRIPGFRMPSKEPNEILIFRGLYVAVYRIASREIHIKPHALDPYCVVDGNPRIVRQASHGPSHYWSLAVPLYAQALLVCYEQLKWPDPDRVRAINNGMYSEA
jgi:Family of unknown function (DUF5677)